MAKTIRCRDLGLDCNYEARADDPEELLELVRHHARRVHSLEEMSEAMVAKIRGAMHDVD
jgi:predicted small metal-binding protein